MRNVLEYGFLFAVLMVASLVLAGCAGLYYEKYQTVEMMSGIPNCAGLHTSRAKWHYNDTYGNRIDVTGRCTEGMMNGNFDYSLNGTFIARAKIVTDREVSTACFVGKKHRSTLYICMNEALAGFMNAPLGAAPVQQVQPVVIPAQQGQAVMVPIQSGQAIVVPAQQGQVIMVPVQQGQPVMVPVQPGQAVAAPNQQGQTQTPVQQKP